MAKPDSKESTSKDATPAKPWFWSRSNILAGLTLVSAISYLSAYLYEVGYTYYYTVPFDFVALSSTTVFYRALYILIGLIPIIAFMSLAPHIFPKLLYKLHPRPVPPAASYFFLSFILLIGVDGVWTTAYYDTMTSAFPSFVICLVVTATLLTIAIRTAYRRYASTSQAPHSHSSAHTGRLIAFSLLSLCIVICSPMIGYRNGKFKTSYLAVNDERSLVVLRAYGDTALCARYDADKHEIYPWFETIKLYDKSTPPLLILHTGRLHAANGVVFQLPVKPNSSSLPATAPATTSIIMQ